MKSFMVVSQNNDPFYIDYDVEFAQHIISKAKAGGLMEVDNEATELDANLVMQFFSPLVLSQWMLIDQTKEPCSSILCPDGFLFAFKHVDDDLYIAVNGDRTESETFLHRKIQVFISIMRFIFGPAGKEMSQSQTYSKKGKWAFLHQLMQNWSDLVHSEQAFLVEAIERVHVNQMVNEKCIETLLKSVKQFQAARDQPAHHALLLVNSKLLALYSNRSAHELRPKDLLMTMILSRTLYPQTDRLEDLFSKFYINTKSQVEPSILVDDNSDAGEDEYHSLPNTPRGSRSRSPTTVHLSEMKNADLSDPESQSDKENMTLLDMFKEKFPDALLDNKFEKSGDKMSRDDEQSVKSEEKLSLTGMHNDDKPGTTLTSTDVPATLMEKTGNETKDSQIISIEVVVHEVPDEHLGLQTSGVHKSSQQQNNNIKGEEIVGGIDLNNSNLMNQQNQALASHDENDMTSNSLLEKMKPEKCNDQIKEESVSKVTSETVHKENADHIMSLDNNKPEPFSAELKDHNGMVTNRDLSEVNRSSGISVKNYSPLTLAHENIQSQQEGSISIGISFHPPPTLDDQVSSSHQQSCVNSIPSSENVINEDIPAPNNIPFHIDTSPSSRKSSPDPSNKKRSSTSSQSGEPEVSSRTSSVISYTSKDYPALLPLTGRALQVTETTVSQSVDLNKEKTASRRIKKTMGALKPGVLHSSLPITTKSATESSSVTYDTANSLSAFSSSSGGSIYLPQTIFLETSTCVYSPYNLYTVQITPGLTLIMLSQAPRYPLADSLYQVIQTIQDVIYGRRSKLPRSRSSYVYDTISGQLGRIHNSMKKLKGRVKKLSYEALTWWEKEDIKYKFLDFLEKDSSVRIPLELESPLMELYKKLRELFSHLFLSPVNYTSQLWDTLSQIRDRIRVDLMDYREYLNVKAQRNITMTSYIDEFPGLIHFIFIDRHFHQMTAPSLNISLKAGENMDATSYLKEKIWKMYQHMMSKLTEGYTTVLMRDGDFYFSYFLWFEDYTGNPISVQESYKPSRKQPYPGILCGQFYKDLIQSCFPLAIQGSIHCMEMFLMHLGAVHPMYIAAHCRKLAYKMWEMSGEIHHSVNLL